MNTDELRGFLVEPSSIAAHSFEVASELARRVADDGAGEGAEYLLRFLEHRELFGASGSILDGLVRQVGLYPYLAPEDLGETDAIAYEYHRAPGVLEQEFVFHRLQGAIYRELADGRSVVLSAPTSFGKSLLIDAIVASGAYRNIVVVVPTIALIDETRRRLNRFKNVYKVITHASQAPTEYNIFVMTPERVVEGLDVSRTDFFVIDEFYKIDASDERGVALNHAFYKLVRTGAQFYMLGPNIRAIPDGFTERFQCTFVHTDYRTVASEIRRIPGRGRELVNELVGLCGRLTEPTLVYCSSPGRVRMVVKNLLDGNIGSEADAVSEAAEWIGENYHPDWLLTRALQRGIGYHHGRLPRALSELTVRAFNNEQIPFLVCTSTLIEGVNTKAKNVIVYDNKVARRKFDYFTFNNIAGRSGRMFEHFVGHVYVFHEPPVDELPFVDVPAFSQDEATPDSLLLQLENEDLTPRSRERIADVVAGGVLPIRILRENHGIDPQYQLELAEELAAGVVDYHRSLAWTGFPTYGQLKAVCDLIHKYFVRTRQRLHGVSSGSQLTYLMMRFMRERSVRAVIDQELRATEAADPDVADERVEAVLDFLRYWASYNFPRYLRAVDGLQRYIFEQEGLAAGDYTMLATQIENYFLDPAVYALDEYGIPMEVGRKLQPYLNPGGDLDLALRRLRGLRLEQLPLSSFERRLVSQAVAEM